MTTASKKTHRPRALKVEFVLLPDWAGVPPPEPASNFLPQWYRRTPQHDNSRTPFGPGASGPPTFKKCMPFLDAMTAGYVIPLWFDLAVSQSPEGSTVFNWRVFGSGAPHIDDQLGGETYPGGTEIFKVFSPWVINTPPGVSCLFTEPLNQVRDPRFQFFSGIVETDSYRHPVNLPFLWHDKDFVGVIPRGTPIIQVVPFQRRAYRLDTRDAAGEDNTANNETLSKVSSVFTDGYRDGYWEKKQWV